jgi:hypothetical protein
MMTIPRTTKMKAVANQRKLQSPTPLYLLNSRCGKVSFLVQGYSLTILLVIGILQAHLLYKVI